MKGVTANRERGKEWRKRGKRLKEIQGEKGRK